MKKSLIDRIFQQKQINFWLTNRIPRRRLTALMGWYSRIESPTLTKMSLAVWRLFASDLNLAEAKKTTFRSLHDCFIRELKDDARPIDTDPNIITSPCDAIVGEFGTIQGTQLFQAKGFPYTLAELLQSPQLVERYRDGNYVTLRLKSSMYHRFHAPYDCTVQEVNYISGDVWNVNPIALRRIPRLFCQNERAIIPLQIRTYGPVLTLVPVAAILVASIHLNFLDVLLNLKYRGANRIACQAAFKKGAEMGYFHHGSTIIVFATRQLRICPEIQTGARLHVGQALFQNAQFDK